MIISSELLYSVTLNINIVNEEKSKRLFVFKYNPEI